MDPSELLRIVDAIHRDKNIDKEIVFEGIEAAIVTAAKKHYGEEEDIQVKIDPRTGLISGTHNGIEMAPDELYERIGAQAAKQVMIQKIREAERDHLFNEYDEQRGQLVTGTIRAYMKARPLTMCYAARTSRPSFPAANKSRSETHHVNERVRATVYEVRKAGSRVKVILSRTKPQLVQRLFEQEIPEISEGVIEMRSTAREPGYRTKVAVSSMDQRVDCVGACVGVRETESRTSSTNWRASGSISSAGKRRHAGAHSQCLAAGRSGRGDSLPDAWPRHRAGPRGPSSRWPSAKPRAERPPRQQTLRLGHRRSMTRDELDDQMSSGR